MAQFIITLIRCLYCALLLCTSAQATLFPTTAPKTFAPVDQAFTFDFQQTKEKIQLSWQIQPGYYLYQHKITVTPSYATLGPFTLPTGQPYKDEFFGNVNIYTGHLSLTIPLLQADADSQLSVTYQGCAEAGFCYPPETRVIPLSYIQQAPLSAPTSEPQHENASQPASLPFSPLWALLLGIAIAFTPCVLPMYPLITGVILGQERPYSHRQLLLLSFAYVQGMALAYTLLGLAVAAAGLKFQATLQHPYVLIGLSVLFILLALSMFGVYSLQFSAAMQTRLTQLCNTQRAGSLLGVFTMGAIAGLICSPCTTAPLSAILLYIAQSGHLLAGGITLYLYALGMGLPLILATLFGNRLLPRSGPWMQHVKQGFGFVILAMPIFLLERLLGETWGMRLWALLGVAFFGWAFTLSLRKSHAGFRILQLILLAVALICARPLQDWVFNPTIAQGKTALTFQPVSSVTQLEKALSTSKGKLVMLDIYADWCTACKEFDRYTFSDPLVQQLLSNIQLLQVDVTANNAEDIELYQHLDVKGLPTILFFDTSGKELRQHRINGFLNAEDFLRHLQSNIVASANNSSNEKPPNPATLTEKPATGPLPTVFTQKLIDDQR